jgi:hypothetical protein
MHSTMHPFLTICKGIFLCIQGCIPNLSCIQGYILMHSRMQLVPTMYSRIHFHASKDASLSHHALKDTFLFKIKNASLPYHLHNGIFLCIQGCIPSLSCTQRYIYMHSRMHPFPTTSARVCFNPFQVVFRNHVLNHGQKGTCLYSPGFIPPRQCTQGYTSMQSRIHPCLTIFSRVHSNIFIDASISNHVLKGTFLCIPGCIPF